MMFSNLDGEMSDHFKAQQPTSRAEPGLAQYADKYIFVIGG